MKNTIVALVAGFVCFVTSSVAFAQDEAPAFFQMEVGPLCGVDQAKVKELETQVAQLKAQLSQCQEGSDNCKIIKDKLLVIAQGCGYECVGDSCTKKKASGGGGGGGAAKPLPPCADGFVRVWKANTRGHECVAAVPIIQQIWVEINALKSAKLTAGEPVSSDFDALIAYVGSLRNANLTPEGWERVLEAVDKTVPGLLGRIQALETRVADHDEKIGKLRKDVDQLKENVRAVQHPIRLELGAVGFGNLRGSPAMDSFGGMGRVGLVFTPDNGKNGILIGGGYGVGHTKLVNTIAGEFRISYLRGVGSPDEDGYPVTLQFGGVVQGGRSVQPFQGSYYNAEYGGGLELGARFTLPANFFFGLGVVLGVGDNVKFDQLPEGWQRDNTGIMPYLGGSLGIGWQYKL